MRYYAIGIWDNESAMNSGVIAAKSFSSLTALGTTNTGALNIELDITMAPMDVPVGGSSLVIWGISIDDIGTSSNLSGKFIKVWGGMEKGLPLANPKQNGLLLQGVIQQAFGNWQGTDQNITIVIMPSSGSSSKSPRLTLDLKKGQPLSNAITNSLTACFPLLKTPSINLVNPIVATEDNQFFDLSVTQFSKAIKNYSQKVNASPDYGGINLFWGQNAFEVSDYQNSSGQDLTLIEYVDLIGQPTWLSLVEVAVKCVMRADLIVGQWVKLEENIQKLSAKSYALYKKDLTFSGIYQITAMRHIGNFRQQDANSWVTNLTLVAEVKPV